jgi:hypothetical protein
MADESMKRQVGKALQEKWNAMQDLPPIELTDEEMDELGAAAIEAMREPTEEMLYEISSQVGDYHPDSDHGPSAYEIAKDAWSAAIDAALNSSTTVPNKDQA